MAINIKSMQGRLLNIAKEKKLDFQMLLNRLAAEQFLFRLSQSSHVDKFVFKGGSLLAYLIQSDRKTKDLDFSIKQMSHEVEGVSKIIESILSIPVDDEIKWGKVDGEPLLHPEMDYPGVRIQCRFLWGNMKGMLRMDMAIGDLVKGEKLSLPRIAYRGQPFFEGTVSLLVYPPEAVFSEKLHIVQNKRGQNTRMKDYYDLSLLIDYGLDREKVKQNILETFTNRELAFSKQIDFEKAGLDRLQTYWEHFLKKEKFEDLPTNISEIIAKLNAYLKKLYD